MIHARRYRRTVVTAALTSWWLGLGDGDFDEVAEMGNAEDEGLDARAAGESRAGEVWAHAPRSTLAAVSPPTLRTLAHRATVVPFDMHVTCARGQ
jgi:hypothetical protein